MTDQPTPPCPSQRGHRWVTLGSTRYCGIRGCGARQPSSVLAAQSRLDRAIGDDLSRR